MIKLAMFNRHILVPALDAIQHNDTQSREITRGSCLTESGLRAVRQMGGGPALGPGQMEPYTHDSLWDNLLQRADKQYLVAGLQTLESDAGNADALEYNPFYAVAMTRIKYLSVPEALPPAGHVEAQAHYYKQHYNTPEGAATVEDYIQWGQRIAE